MRATRKIRPTEIQQSKIRLWLAVPGVKTESEALLAIGPIPATDRGLGAPEGDITVFESVKESISRILANEVKERD